MNVLREGGHDNWNLKSQESYGIKISNVSGRGVAEGSRHRPRGLELLGRSDESSC